MNNDEQTVDFINRQPLICFDARKGLYDATRPTNLYEVSFGICTQAEMEGHPLFREAWKDHSQPS